MTRCVPILVALLAPLLLACQGLPAHDDETAPAIIKVLSYNIHYGLGTDSETDLERIAQVIQRSGAGIVGLQEIGNKAMALELGHLTGMHAVFGRSKEDDKGYGDAILCKYPLHLGGRRVDPKRKLESLPGDGDRHRPKRSVWARRDGALHQYAL